MHPQCNLFTNSHSIQARAVLVDMESKVVQASLLVAHGERALWEFDPDSAYSQKSGSGNNWASGYCQHGPACCDHVRDLIRRQTERCDRLDSFLVLSSVAGGTGSGMGAYITEMVREDFPRETLLNQVVWPYQSGEVIVQDYNALLTTARLQEAADSILLLSNDQLHKACTKLLHLKHITFANINRVMCHALASVLQPSVSSAHLGRPESRMTYQQCCVSTLPSLLCPHGGFKLLSLKNIPQMPQRSQAYSRHRWAGLLKHLRQMLITDAPIDEGMDWTVEPTPSPHHPPPHIPPPLTHPSHINRSLANLLVLRGNELETADPAIFLEPQLYTPWTPTSARCTTWCDSHAFNWYEKSCTLVSNSQSCLPLLDCVCRKAWNMFTARAYVHQYEQHGWGLEDFMESFVTVEQVLRDYARLGS